MNFLLRNLFDDHIKLDAAQQKAVRLEVRKRFAREKYANLLRMIPGMLPLLMIPVWTSVRSRYGLLVDAACEITFVLIVLVLIWWMFRRAAFRHARAAIRDLGIADICSTCGYDLSAQTGDAADRCPECGREVSTFASSIHSE